MIFRNLLSYILLISLSINSSNASKYLRSNTLLTCMENSEFSSTFFDVYYYPHNSTAVFTIDGSSAISGKIKAHFELIVYGLSVYQDSIDLCSLNYPTICPISSGHINLEGTYQIQSDLTNQIPSIAYTIPDLDAYVLIMVYSTDDDDNESP